MGWGIFVQYEFLTDPKYAPDLPPIRKHRAIWESHFHTLLHDLFKQLLEQLRFLKAPMPVLGESGVMGNLLIEPPNR